MIAMSHVLPVTINAQEAAYKFDMGASLGMSGYLGDANRSNLFSHPGFTGGVLFRYLVNTRWAIRGTASAATLSGDSADMTNVFPGGETYSFSSTAYTLDGRAEFNFFNYGIGETYRKLSRWSPYLSLGLGLNVASCEGTHAAFCIPMGAGVKYKINPRLNLALDWTMCKVFGDNVDGTVLDDVYGIKSTFVKNTDWISTVTLSLTYEFGERCRNCFYLD